MISTESKRPSGIVLLLAGGLATPPSEQPLGVTCPPSSPFYEARQVTCQGHDTLLKLHGEAVKSKARPEDEPDTKSEGSRS